MDKLEAVRRTSIHLDRMRDEEFYADQAWQRAKARLIEADKEYVAAMDALHEARTASNDDDTQAQASLAGTG